MGWFDRAVKSGVDQAIAKASAPGGLIQTRVGEIMDEVMRERAVKDQRVKGNLTATSFVWQAAFHLLRTDPHMKVTVARDRAAEAIREFLRDEKIKFGNKQYAWDQEAAETIAREYETDHWEAHAHD